MTARRAVVTGASGLLGASVMRHLRHHFEGVDGWSCTTPRLPGGQALRRTDLLEEGPRILREVRPELVIHCAAMTDVDRCEAEPLRALQLNTEAPRRLAAAARSVGSRFLHISTDAVYDGEASGAHAEDADVKPCNEYAKTKLLGEEEVLREHPDALVIRTTMHGWSPRGARSFSEVVLSRLARNMPVQLFADVMFSPLLVSHLARQLLDLACTDARGVVNAGARDAVSKEDFGRLLARSFRMDEGLVVSTRLAQRRLAAQRPRNTRLDVSLCERLLGGPAPSVVDGVLQMLAEGKDGTAATLKGRYPESGLVLDLVT